MRRRYKVLGQHNVFDKPPGTIFEADLDEKQEARMLRRGALMRMPPARTERKEAKRDG